MLNKFASPISEGIYRAALNALGTFTFVALTAYQGFKLIPDMSRGDRLEDAIIAGIVAAVAPFATGALMAKSDQNRAEHMDSRAADVPIAAGRK